MLEFRSPSRKGPALLVGQGGRPFLAMFSGDRTFSRLSSHVRSQCLLGYYFRRPFGPKNGDIRLFHTCLELTSMTFEFTFCDHKILPKARFLSQIKLI